MTEDPQEPSAQELFVTQRRSVPPVPAIILQQADGGL